MDPGASAVESPTRTDTALLGRQGASGHRDAPGDAASTQQRIEAKVRQRLFAPQPTLTHIGRFRVLEPVGRGGMGVVYAAYDENLDRKVAIKILLADELPNEEDRLRFFREAQALARLSHPHVVTVHEVGQSDGQVFLAMEYIRGQSFVDWLHTKPDWPQVVEAFVQAGWGLAAAHHADLVHRDLKPANIMRSDDGVVKVLDFGLARAAESELADSLDQESLSSTHSALSSSLTKTGALMGTPRYMAPEQLNRGPVDGRSDQYSFCVALWEGLTGAPPFAGSTLGELLRARLQGPPAWPSAAPPVPRAIVEAIRRGLAPDPRERWPSMEPLLLTLWPDPQPRRHRWWQLTTTGVLVVGGVTALAWSQAQTQRCRGAQQQLAGIWDDTRRAEIEAAIVGIGRSYASDVWSRTQRELDAYAHAWAAMHTQTCEATAVRQEQSTRVMDMRMSCLDRASAELEATVSTLADADAKTVTRAHALVASLRPLSRCADVEALEAEVEPPLSREAPAVQLARWQLARAKSLRISGHYSRAGQLVKTAALALEGVEYGPVRTELMLERGKVFERLGEYEASEQALLEAMEHASRGGQQGLVADAARELMVVVGDAQQRADAAMLLAPLVLGSPHADPVEQAASRTTLAHVLRMQGKYTEAEAEYRAALALRLEALGPDHPDVAGSRNNLGVILAQQKRFDEAEAELRAGLALRQQVLGPDHPDVAGPRNNLANLLNKQGRYEEAEAQHRAALALRQRALGPNHPDVAKSQDNLANALQARGKYEEAEAQHRAALALRQKTLGPDHPTVALSRHNLANALRARGQYEQAEAEYRAALALQQRTLGPDHPSIATVRDNLANALRARGQHHEAQAEYRAALALRQAALDPEHPDLAQSHTYLAEVLLALDREDEARPLAEQGWARHRRDDIRPSDRAYTAFVLARVLWSIEGSYRDRTRARALAEDAVRSYRAAGAAHESDARDVEQWLSAR
ncbi:MAG: serine/threonine-protein kinase [Myxococcota bacterium]